MNWKLNSNLYRTSFTFFNNRPLVFDFFRHIKSVLFHWIQNSPILVKGHANLSLFQARDFSAYLAFICRIFFYFIFNKLCRGKAMVAYTKPQQMRREESKWLRGEIDCIKFIVGFRKAEEGKTFHKLHVLGMNDELWDRDLG